MRTVTMVSLQAICVNEKTVDRDVISCYHSTHKKTERKGGRIMFTVNAGQKKHMCGMMNQEMCMDMCMYMSMFCCAFMYQRLPGSPAAHERIAGGDGL